MRIQINPERRLAQASPLLYGHFLEHFHRQVYGGVYDPQSPLANEHGFRSDVIEALQNIRTPIIRWPGGCFVSSYNWKKGVGENRTPVFDKSWRVEEPNTFGTDEFVQLCRDIGCEPYICTNAGTGTAEEMSDWVEYCNLPTEGEFAKWRIRNGHEKPHNVKYWSVGNENYGYWEIGAKGSEEWARLVTESAKMMQHVDPTTSLTAAALVDMDWNTRLLESCGNRLEWISLHGYWDFHHGKNETAPYTQCMAYTHDLDAPIRKVQGLLNAMGLEKKIKIAFDEWNLRAWFHPGVHTIQQAVTKEEYLDPHNGNDDNAIYTMADAVFSGCFLNMVLRHADIVGMANFAPVINTRGAIFTHPGGIVKRTTYHVFDMYVHLMGDEVIDQWVQDVPAYRVCGEQGEVDVDCIDVVSTRRSHDGAVAIALVNKHISDSQQITLTLDSPRKLTLHTLCGTSPDDYNDVGKETVVPFINNNGVEQEGLTVRLTLQPHSVNILVAE